MDELELETTDSSNGNETESAEERLVRVEATNAKLYERTKKAEAEAKALREKPITNQQDIPKPSEILKAPEFRLSRQGYDEDEIDLIMRNGGPEILKDDKHIITQGIKVSREQRGAEEAASRVSDSSGLSDIERKFSEADLRKMTKEELAAILPYTDN